MSFGYVELKRRSRANSQRYSTWKGQKNIGNLNQHGNDYNEVLHSWLSLILICPDVEKSRSTKFLFDACGFYTASRCAYALIKSYNNHFHSAQPCWWKTSRKHTPEQACKRACLLRTGQCFTYVHCMCWSCLLGQTFIWLWPVSSCPGILISVETLKRGWSPKLRKVDRIRVTELSISKHSSLPSIQLCGSLGKWR